MFCTFVWPRVCMSTGLIVNVSVSIEREWLCRCEHKCEHRCGCESIPVDFGLKSAFLQELVLQLARQFPDPSAHLGGRESLLGVSWYGYVGASAHMS